MSGWTAATYIAAASAAVGTYSAISQNQQAKKAASQNAFAQAQAQANADRQAKAAEEQMNQQNRKRPDANALLSAARGFGGSSTMLTGSQGITGGLSLGKSTLLGE